MQIKDFIAVILSSDSNIEIIAYSNYFTLKSDSYYMQDLLCHTQRGDEKRFTSLDTIYKQLQKYKFTGIVSLKLSNQLGLV
jgi:hypothetical protein